MLAGFLGLNKKKITAPLKKRPVLFFLGVKKEKGWRNKNFKNPTPLGEGKVERRGKIPEKNEIKKENFFFFKKF